MDEGEDQGEAHAVHKPERIYYLKREYTYLIEYKGSLNNYFNMLVISYFEFDGVNSFSKLFPAGNVGSISDLIAILRSLMCPRRKAIKLLIVTL